MTSFTLTPEEPEFALLDFRESVSTRLLQRVDPMPEAAFWSTLASVGCDSGALAERASQLARQLAPATLLSAGRRMDNLRFAFIERLMAWEQSSGSRFPLANIGSRRDLASHFILLGEEPYAAALREPSRAWPLAEAGDFLAEGRTLFQKALEQYPLEVLERALREALPPVRYEPSVTLWEGQVIDHAELGLGVVCASSSDGAEVRFRTGTSSVSGPHEEGFRQAVLNVLSMSNGNPPEDARWRVLVQLGWGRESLDRSAMREQILASLSLAECCAMASWLHFLKYTLTRALTKRDEDSGGKLSAALGPGKGTLRRIASQVIALGKEAYGEVLADPSRVMAESFGPRLKTVESRALTSDNPFADAQQRYPDTELLPALRELRPEPYHASMTWRGQAQAVESRRHGPGVIIGPGEGGEGLRVVFPEGPRTLRGPEAPAPREVFLKYAWEALRGHGEPMSEPSFWSLIEQLGWGRPSTDIDALAQKLAIKLSPLELEGMSDCFSLLRTALSRHLEAWEESLGGQQIEAGDDSFSDLVSHIIGLGEGEYRRVSAAPELAAQRALKRDYTESFAYVFLRARDAYPLSEVERALRQVLTPARYAPAARLEQGQLLEHPEQGLGFAMEASTEGRVRVIFPDAELTLAE